MDAPYIAAKSASSITLCPRSSRIDCSILSAGITDWLSGIDAPSPPAPTHGLPYGKYPFLPEELLRLLIIPRIEPAVGGDGVAELHRRDVVTAERRHLAELAGQHQF